MRGDNVKLRRLEVTIDLRKSKLYVKTKQKFSKHISSFASKVDKRKIVEVNGEWKLLQRKQRNKYTNPKGRNVTVSGLWFKVSEKIWKIEPSPEQPLKNVFTGSAPRSLHFCYI